MSNLNIYSKQEVINKGNEKINKDKKILRIVGAIIFAMSLLTLISLILPEFSEYKSTELYIGIPLFAVIGITLFSVSFIKRNPYKVGISTFKKNNQVDDRLEKALKNQVIEPDKELEAKEYNIEIQTDLFIFKILGKDNESKVLGPDDISRFEIIVDDEEVFDSTNEHSESNLSFDGGKLSKSVKSIGSILSRFRPIAGTALSIAGDAVGSTNADKKSVKDSVTGSKKVVHKYTFVLHVNDLNFPSLVLKDIPLELAEELGNTFAIIYSHSMNALTYKGETEIHYSKKNIQEIPEKNKQIEYKADKFEEIKKYKELLDQGIISQEEFDNKKKELQI